MKSEIKNPDRGEIMSLLRIDEEIGKEDYHKLLEMIDTTANLYVGFISRKIVCIWGLVPPTLLSNSAYLWLYTTERIKDHEFIFVRKSQIAVEEMLTMYDTVYGYTASNNHRAIKWLRWLGAEFEHSEGKMLNFTIRKKRTWQPRQY